MSQPRDAAPCSCCVAPRTVHTSAEVRVAPLRADVPNVGTLRLCPPCREGQDRAWRWRWRSLDHELAPDCPPPRRSTGRLRGDRLPGSGLRRGGDRLTTPHPFPLLAPPRALARCCAPSRTPGRFSQTGVKATARRPPPAPESQEPEGVALEHERELRVLIEQLASCAGIARSSLDADRADVAVFHPARVMREGCGDHTVVASTAPPAKRGWPVIRDRPVDGFPAPVPVR
jgi:hypothetical protein